jgi:Flp pilus assembly pilin Flp
MMKFIANFRKDEDGAVTVDWVVLTAAVVGLAVAAYSSIESGASSLTDRTTSFLNEQTPGAFGGGTGGGEGEVGGEGGGEVVPE